MSLYIYVATLVCWIAAIILIRVTLARPKPPRALLERTENAVILALFLSIFAVLRWNADNGFPLVSLEGGRNLIALAASLLIVKPVGFIILYAVNGFRDSEP